MKPRTGPNLTQQVIDFTAFNSHTFNVDGVAHAAALATQHLQALGTQPEHLTLPPFTEITRDGTLLHRPLGPAVRAIKRPELPRRALLSIHLDTVHLPSSDFTTRHDIHHPQRLIGPGVVDAKGGLVVLLEALRLFEQTPESQHLGWEVLLNPDEEIGSPSSAPLLKESAARCAFGLVYEPSLPDGHLVAARKGSGTYTLFIKGRSAHVGRDFLAGRSALLAAARASLAIDALNGTLPGTLLNVGVVESGSASNVVPDTAVLRINVRVEDPATIPPLQAQLEKITASLSQTDGITATLHGSLTSPPRPVSHDIARMLNTAKHAALTLGILLDWRDSGGTCDGNKLAAAGLPVLDSLGPTGGHLHSPQEYVLTTSLQERARLSCILLQRLAHP